MDGQLKFVRKLLADTCYSVQAKLSEGAYGEVYKAVQVGTQAAYALKLIDMNTVSKLHKTHEVLLEVKTLQKMNHPGVVKLIQTFKKENYMVIVMQLGPFGDMFSFLSLVHSHPILHQKKNKILTYYLAQALEVIDYIHSLGILHRDIKPENFILGQDLRIRLIDFATTFVTDQAHLFSPQQTLQLELQTNSAEQKEGLIGTANYISPECLKLQYTKKGDIWAFGVMAYKFYLNKLPFEGNTEADIFRSIIEDEIDLSKVEPQVQQLLVLCLKKDPDERPTAKMLKMCTIFKRINFKDIFYLPPPHSKSELPHQIMQKYGLLLEKAVEKKMFFGNFKPRLLTISKAPEGLMMAYRYVDTRKVKKQFLLGVNDYASAVSEREFEVVTKGSTYVFRVDKGESGEETVSQINSLIRQAYKLE